MKHRSRSRAQTEQERWLRRKNFCSLHSHTHTLLLLVLVLSALSHSYSYLECSCTPTSTSLWPPYHGTAEHTHTGTDTHVYSLYLFFHFVCWLGVFWLRWFHFICVSISFRFRQQRALSLHLACADCSPHYPTRLHTHTRHTQIEQVACNQ